MLTNWETERNAKIKKAFEREKEKMEQMTPEVRKQYARQRLLQSGIIDENGILTKEYGDGSNPNTAERSEELYKQIKKEDLL